jgi:hypothetical protein
LPALWGWVVHGVFARLHLERHLPDPPAPPREPADAAPEKLYYQI